VGACQIIADRDVEIEKFVAQIILFRQAIRALIIEALGLC
jgi:hypothetical protein